MANGKLTETVYNMALPVAEKNGCTVYEVEYKKEGSDYVLRVILDSTEDDSQGYVSLNSCEAVSRELSDLLDDADLIPGTYMLEVTSPGLDRPLKKDEDFKRFSGREIDIGLYKALNGSKTVSGILKGMSDGIITIENTEGVLEIDRKDAAYVKLAVIF